MHLDSEVSLLRHKGVDCMWGGGSPDGCGGLEIPALYINHGWMHHYLLATMERGKKQHTGKLQRVLREQKARLYIIRRCVVMLLCWSD
ncbi:hypothetical protein QOZ80_6AG0531530 [Eleusine coracana subsp. coracana]|nr:hypothetical protein QOZ80_6AG0531530 [Eleusine coracana subsp. coracana]